MNLRQQYTKETGKDANRMPCQPINNYTTEYIEWLEQKLRQSNVVGRSEQLVCDNCAHYEDGISPDTFCIKCGRMVEL